MEKQYDIVIIGAGSAGLTAAGLAKQIGVQVALLENDKIGGDCTWTGCIPSKTLLHTTRVINQIQNAEKYGLPKVDAPLDYQSVMSHVRTVVETVYKEESPEKLRDAGIDVFFGDPRFLDPHTVRIGETDIKGRSFLLCTGAHPAIPPVAGLNDVNYLTYVNIWDLKELPRRLLILGAGPIGCEMAQSFCRLGAEVTIIEGGDRLLPRDEPEVSELIYRLYTSEKINLNFNNMVENIWEDSKGIHLIAGGKDFLGDNLLVATGRRPNVENLGLDKAGIDYSVHGIKVDNFLSTSQRHIYAAGDCTGGYQFTHYAGWQAAMAVRNILLPGRTKGVSDKVPWTTFTEPEVAHIGLSEEQANKKFGDDVMVCRWPMDRVDRSLAENSAEGFMKLIHKRNGTILGVTIVAARAGEMIHEWIVALEKRMKVGDLSNIIHVYPTYSTASMQAAAEIRVSQLLEGTSGKVIRGLIHLMH
ncbi:MAG: FAD-dependent oxidoreductase [Dehalococcoidales bacterium]|nr:MAG: FAD-dependent oxidoreductase [Dehalococcoidales bacterium]